MCMFDKVHLTFNFKSKVTCDVPRITKWMSIGIDMNLLIKMSPQCHMPRGTCQLTCGFFPFTNHTTCQTLHRTCRLTCVLLLCKFLRIKCHKLAKTLSNIPTGWDRQKFYNWHIFLYLENSLTVGLVTMHTSSGEKVLTWTALLACKLGHFALTRARAHTHTRPRARDQYTSSTLIGGKGGAGPRSHHTMLEGPTEYVYARWMWTCEVYMDSFLHGIEMDHVSWSLGLFSINHLLEVNPPQNWETMALWMLTIVKLFYLIVVTDPQGVVWSHMWPGPQPNAISMNSYTCGYIL
jgi:hypothetical protein